MFVCAFSFTRVVTNTLANPLTCCRGSKMAAGRNGAVRKVTKLGIVTCRHPNRLQP